MVAVDGSDSHLPGGVVLVPDSVAETWPGRAPSYVMWPGCLRAHAIGPRDAVDLPVVTVEHGDECDV